MKQSLLLLVLVSFFSIVQAQSVVDKIDVSFDNPMVTRVAIALSKDADWSYTVDKDKHLVNVVIKNCNVSNPIITGLNKSNLVSDIDLSNSNGNGLLALTLAGPFYIETLTVDNPFKIVLDLFVYKNSYSYTESHQQAIFYEKSGMYSKAGRQYAKMQSNFPDNKDTNYYWGSLYIKQRKPDKAKEKMQAVTKESQFYMQAQAMLAKLDGKELPIAKKVEPVIEQEITEKPLPVIQESTKISDQGTVIPKKVIIRHKPFKFFDFRTLLSGTSQKIANSKLFVLLRSLPIWFWIIVLVTLGIVALVIFDVMRLRRKEGKKRKTNKTAAQAQSKSKLNIVVKLLEKGWKEKEIARELQISPKEAHTLIKQGKKIYAQKAKQSK